MSALCQNKTNGTAAKAFYSITSSAIARTPGGIVGLSAFAVLKLIATIYGLRN